MRILDDQHHRPGLGQVLEQGEHLPEHSRPGLARISLDAGLAQLGQQPGQVPRAPARQQGREAVGAQLAGKLPQHPGERRERQALRAQIQAIPGQHPDRAGRPRPGPELAGQP